MKNLVCIARSQCKKFSLVCCMHFSATQHRAQVTSSPSQLRFAFHHDRASVFASKEEEGRAQWHASVKAFTPSFADAGPRTAARSSPHPTSPSYHAGRITCISLMAAGWHCGHLGDSVYIHLSCCWWCHSVQCMHGAWEAASTHTVTDVMLQATVILLSITHTCTSITQSADITFDGALSHCCMMGGSAAPAGAVHHMEHGLQSHYRYCMGLSMAPRPSWGHGGASTSNRAAKPAAGLIHI